MVLSPEATQDKYALEMSAIIEKFRKITKIPEKIPKSFYSAGISLSASVRNFVYLPVQPILTVLVEP